jgi:hypothetical protein
VVDVGNNAKIPNVFHLCFLFFWRFPPGRAIRCKSSFRHASFIPGFALLSLTRLVLFKASQLIGKYSGLLLKIKGKSQNAKSASEINPEALFGYR